MSELLKALNNKIRENNESLFEDVFGRCYENECYEVYIKVLRVEGQYKIYQAKKSYNTAIEVNVVTVQKDIIKHLAGAF